MRVTVTVTYDNGHEYEMDVVHCESSFVSFPIHKRQNAPFLDVVRLSLSLETLSKPEDDARLAQEQNYRVTKQHEHGTCIG
jgi:hypothetical protein